MSGSALYQQPNGEWAAFATQADGSGLRVRVNGLQGYVVLPNALIPPLTLTRSQAGSVSTALGPSGVAWSEFGANTPRFSGAARRALLEGQRANGFVNPRCEGAVPGSPGQMPASWSDTVPAGVTRTVVGTGAELGLPYIELRLQTAGAVIVEPIEFQPGHVPASTGQTWTCSAFFRLTGGSMTNASLALRIYELGGTPAVTDTAFVPNATTARTAATRTVSDVGSFVVNGRLLLQTSGAADLTLRVYAPQMELGSFASTPILPPVGAPAASTRGADIVTAPLSALGVGSNGACTALFSGVLPRVPTDIFQTPIQLDDGSDTNRYLVRFEPGSAEARMYRVTGLGTPGPTSLGTIAANVPFRLGLTMDGTGRVAGSLNGAAVVVQTGGPTAGMTTLRLGSEASGFAAMFGEISTVRVTPGGVSDAALQALVAGLPT